MQYLTAEALSSYIKKRLLLLVEYEKRAFPFPFLLWKEVADDEALSLLTHGCIPRTNLPHVFYLNMTKCYDFSRLISKGEDVIEFFGRDVLFGNSETTALQVIVQKIENIAIKNEQLGNVIKELLTILKQSGKNDLAWAASTSCAGNLRLLVR